MDDTEALARLIDRHSPGDGVHPTAIPRLHLIRSARVTEPLLVLHRPAVCIIAQGRKRVMLAERIYEYDRRRYLIVSFDLPITGEITEASDDTPYLCLRLDLDPALLAALVLEVGETASNGGALPPTGIGSVRGGAASGVMLSDATPALLDAAVRLASLLEAPRGEAAVLAPLIEREILYRLLTGEQGARLAAIAQGEGRQQAVGRAIRWLKHHFDRPFRLETLAAEARMSPSALSQHFKAVTAMSPLQYQKQLRLQEARRLILASAMDAASAGHAVGYDSPSQFSREYARLFGAPPIRDVARLRAEGSVAFGL